MRRRLCLLEGIATRVVSMPCQELFDDQLPEYRESVLLRLAVFVSLRSGIRQGWDKYIGRWRSLCRHEWIRCFGPAPKLYSHFKITADQIVSYAQVAVRGLQRINASGRYQ